MTDATASGFGPGEWIADDPDGGTNVLSEVVVFSDQAYIMRNVRAKANAGRNRFWIEVKALALDPESVQARVFGRGEILSVQYKNVPVKTSPQESLRALEQEKEKLERQRDALLKQREIQNKQIQFLDSLIAFGQTELPKKARTKFPTPESMQSMLEFIDQGYQRVFDKDRDFTIQLQELDKELAVVKSKLSPHKRAASARSDAIEVLFDASEEQDLRLEVCYMAQFAHWVPVYKVDVPLEMDGVAMTLFARIAQNTGENWRDVKLTVSNAAPMTGVELPTAEPWQLAFPRPQFAAAAAGAEMMRGLPKPASVKKRSKSALSLEGEENIYTEVSLDLEELGPADFQQAEARELPLAFEYELPSAVSLDSGGGENLLPVFSKQPKGEFFIYAVPSRDPLAYLVCQITPDAALLPGRLNVHFGGRLVGGTELGEHKAGEELLLNLGVERGVKILREKIAEKDTETFLGGMMDRSNVVREIEYRTSIENTKDKLVSVRVMDNAPVSKTDKIQIKDVTMKPEPTIRDWRDRKGIHLWKFTLEPKGTHEIRLHFVVKHPRDQAPEGL